MLPVLLEALGEFLLPLVLLEALFGRQFSWWKVTFFLSSFLLVLLVDCYCREKGWHLETGCVIEDNF